MSSKITNKWIAIGILISSIPLIMWIKGLSPVDSILVWMAAFIFYTPLVIISIISLISRGEKDINKSNNLESNKMLMGVLAILIIFYIWIKYIR